MERNTPTLDEVLDKFSIFGRYHVQFIIYAMYAYACASIVATTYIFVAEETVYRCVDEAFNNDTCGSVNGLRCAKFVYENPQSFVAEYQLACEEWKRTLLGTVHVFGYMVGLLIVGPLSDRIGRKNTLLLSGVLSAATGVAKSLANSYWMYVCLEFLVSAVGDWYSPLFVLNLEIVSAKKRVIFYLIGESGSTIGAILAPTAAWTFPYWRNFLRAVHIPSFFMLLGLCLIDESPRWLFIRKEKEKAIVVLEKMSKKNNITIDRDALNRMEVEDEGKSIALLNLLKITFQSRTLLKRCMVCIVWWMTSVFVNYGILINSVSLQGNKYINYALVNIVEIPGNLIMMYILARCNRKYPLMASFFTAALLFFVHPFLPKNVPWLSVTVSMASKLMSSFYFSITYIYTSELFPTYTRNSMHAMCSALGRVGGMIAPQTPLLTVYWSGLPSLVFGCASLAAGLVTFLVPDTAHAALPDTVTQAEMIGDKRDSKQVLEGIDNLGMKTVE